MALQTKKRSGINWYKMRMHGAALLFVLPALINFAVFRYYPMIWAFRASLWDYSLLGGFRKFVGFDNYVRALTEDKFFWHSLRVTAVFAIGYVPLVVVLALLLAVFASQPYRGMGLIRGFIFVPVVTSYIVVSIVWGMVLNKDVGLLNGFLSTIGLPRMEYLTSIRNALPTLIGISVWKDVGYSMIILVAGLRGIPEDYYDAAHLDGANAWRRFIDVTVPMLRRHLMFVTVISTLFAFQVFVPIYQLTHGGPARATNVAVYYIYQRAFKFGEMGYASALSVILLVILMVVSLGQMRLMRGDDV
ncbi:MAG: sugar ABC transporter permease [Thermomicrobiales bacterium]|nr:sugar ABC transporter permease [Thermomicrobiales bacterium]